MKRPATYGTRKILSVQGSFTLVPGAKPLTSTYLPSLSNGLTTYPGLPGTAFPVGNADDGAKAREDEAVVDDCGVSVRLVPELALGGGIDWPGLVTSDDGFSIPTMVGDSSPLFRVA